MAENIYECMFLLNSGKFAADPDGCAQQVLDVLEKSGATVVAHRPWQEGKLAYIIEGQRKAVHYLTYVRMDTQGLTGFTRASKLNDLILRHLIVKLPKVLFDRMVELISGESSDSSESDESGESTTDADGLKKDDATKAAKDVEVASESS